MDPETGLLGSRDPWGGEVFDSRSLHRFTYAYQDPVNNGDPSGRTVWQSAKAFLRTSLRGIVSRVPIVAGFLALVYFGRLTFGPDGTEGYANKWFYWFRDEQIGHSYVFTVPSENICKMHVKGLLAPTGPQYRIDQMFEWGGNIWGDFLSEERKFYRYYLPAVVDSSTGQKIPWTVDSCKAAVGSFARSSVNNYNYATAVPGDLSNLPAEPENTDVAEGDGDVDYSQYYWDAFEPGDTYGWDPTWSD